jgi:hypothetical protein
LIKLAKVTAIESQKLPKFRLRKLNFDLDLFGRNVRKSRREIGKHTFERQKLFGRCIARGRVRDSYRRKPTLHHIALHGMHRSLSMGVEGQG